MLLFGFEEQACVSGSDLNCSSRMRCPLGVDVSAIEEGLDAGAIVPLLWANRRVPFNNQRGKNERK